MFDLCRDKMLTFDLLAYNSYDWYIVSGSNCIFSESVWEEEYIASTFSNIYTSLSFDPCTTFDIEYLTNEATTGTDNFLCTSYRPIVGLHYFFVINYVDNKSTNLFFFSFLMSCGTSVSHKTSMCPYGWFLVAGSSTRYGMTFKQHFQLWINITRELINYSANKYYIITVSMRYFHSAEIYFNSTFN